MSIEQINRSQSAPPPALTSTVWSAGKGIARPISERILVDLYIAAEIATLFALGLVIAEIYVGGVLGVRDYFSAYLAPLAALPLIAAFNIHSRGLHELKLLRRFPDGIAPLASAIATSFTVLVVAGFAARVANDYSRVWFVIWCLSSFPAIIVLRGVAATIFARLALKGLIEKTVAIYGTGPGVEEVAASLRAPQSGARLGATFAPEAGPGDPAGLVAGAGALIDYSRRHRLDGVVLVLPDIGGPALKPLLAELAILPCEVQLYSGINGARLPMRGISMIDRLLLLDVQRKPISGWGILAKSALDYALAATAAILAAPLLAAIAIAIKLDSPGPVFFVQRRHGFNSSVIRVFKFRTMTVLEDGDVAVQARRGDSRVTQIGALLRRTSLDELPQIFNVLKGEMSLVGPRPHAMALDLSYMKLLARYQERHRVKPGITGWAQIHGYRGPTEGPELMAKRVEYDLDYIENWSLWLDLKIIAATPFVGMFHKNAV